MKLPRLIFRELLHRKVHSALALLGIVAAVACLTAGISLLRGHDVRTDQILTAAAEQTKARTLELTEDYRKIALEQGFNVFIIPAGESSPLNATAEMPYEHVKKLAGAGIITIEHLLPSLSQSILWPERRIQITLTGIHGEVAIASAGGKSRKPKEPLIQPVLPGEIVLGFEVAKKTGLRPGESVALLGEPFKVTKVQGARGTNDDFTVWIDLAAAQRLLSKEGRISAIQAINCLAPDCHPDATGIPSVSAEIAKVLPDTKVVIDMAKAKARIDNRVRAMREAKAAMDAEAANRAAVRGQMESFASILIPLVIGGAGLWVALLALTNARERRSEVGILRALGVGSGTILALFLGKAAILGVIGAALGYGLGVMMAAPFSGTDLAQVIDPRVAAIVLIGAPLLATLASWLPSMLAAQQDPAAVLGRE